MHDYNNYFHEATSVYYQHKTPIIGLELFDNNSRGEDEFTRKLVWYYIYNDDEEFHKELKNGVTDLIESYLSNSDVDWDLITLYPTHSPGELNPHLKRLMQDVADEVGIPFQQVIRRATKVEESHDLDNVKQKVVNLEGSVEIDERAKGKNIILVDNIALSGTSLLHGTNQLIQSGANNVVSVVLGLDKKLNPMSSDAIKQAGGIESFLQERKPEKIRTGEQ